MMPLSSEIPPPFVVEVSPAPSISQALRTISHMPGITLFDSAQQRDGVGRYSYLMADPLRSFRIDHPRYGLDPFGELEALCSNLTSVHQPDLPSFQGGIAGMLGYELGGCWEQLSRAKSDPFEIPVLQAGLYDWVLAWDHSARRCWLVSQGWGANSVQEREYAARLRAERVLQCLESQAQRAIKPLRLISRTKLAAEQLPPHDAAPGLPGLISDFSRESYLRAVSRVIEYIRAGDIFQANLSQRLLYPLAELHPIELFDRLKTVNPAPFAGLMIADDWAVISASPERFLRVEQGQVETRPIKGTRRRPSGPEADLFTQDELRTSAKDMAENVMIVDLLRNDLSRVCEPGTVRVPQLCAIETFRTVQHLVSEIHGKLRPDESVWHLLRAAFPGGSITGAPKVRAMQIIAELEPSVRGPYTGSFFFVGTNGSADSNLLIRTFVWRRGWLQCGVGGGIVAASEPAAEYEETLHKAAGMLQALR